MRFYLLDKTEEFTGEIEILNFYQSMNVQDFVNNRMYRLPSRVLMQIKHKEYMDYPGILLDPLPLFKENLWKSILQFVEKPLHTHFMLMEEKTRHTQNYYCPAFRRIKGSVKIEGELGEKRTAHILLKKGIPEAEPAFYLQNESRIWVALRLDLLESLMRMGLCNISLLPVEKEEGRWSK